MTLTQLITNYHSDLSLPNNATTFDIYQKYSDFANALFQYSPFQYTPKEMVEATICMNEHNFNDLSKDRTTKYFIKRGLINGIMIESTDRASFVWNILQLVNFHSDSTYRSLLEDSIDAYLKKYGGNQMRKDMVEINHLYAAVCREIVKLDPSPESDEFELMKQVFKIHLKHLDMGKDLTLNIGSIAKEHPDFDK